MRGFGLVVRMKERGREGGREGGLTIIGQGGVGDGEILLGELQGGDKLAVTVSEGTMMPQLDGGKHELGLDGGAASEDVVGFFGDLSGDELTQPQVLLPQGKHLCLQ